MSAAPWSVKGIDPKAREVAKDLARRSGMTLGEWLNTMIMDDADEDESVIPLGRRNHAQDAFDRRGRSRRLDDVYGGPDDTLHRVAASVEAIAGRLEAAERRSTLAIQGVDQAVNGLVRRLDGQEAVGRTYGRRIDDIAEELREGHRRLRNFEQETGPKTAETFGKVETGLGALASRLYDIEERQRTSFNELRQRMEAAEKTARPGPGADLMAQASARLDQAQAQTTAALRGLERSFAGLDQRLRAAEGRVEPEGAREAARFEKLAETLTRQVETNRTEMMRRLDTAEQENRLARIEAAVSAVAEQVKTAEQRSAHGIESMGREVLRIAQNLNGRVQALDERGHALDDRMGRVETGVVEKIAAVSQALASDLNQSVSEKIDREMARHAQIVDHRLTRAEDQQALGLERLGAEITRISDRLSDRIAQSERKSAQALDDVARRLGDSSNRVEQAYGRVSGEMAERLRLSEERTAALIADARETMDRRAEKATEAPIAAQVGDLRQPDWRSAAFPEESFDDESLWASPIREAGAPAPFPAFDTSDYDAPSASVTGRPLAEADPVDRLIADMAADWDAPADAASASVFGGADVADALAATTQTGPAFATQAPAFAPATDAPFTALETVAPLTADAETFAADDDFVDVPTLRAGLSAGVPANRAEATRGTIDAARAAMTAPVAEETTGRGAFGLKRGGKSRLQERLDRQSQRDTSTVRKTVLASAVAVAVVGGVYTTGRLSDVDVFSAPDLQRVLGLGNPAGAGTGSSTMDDARVAEASLAAVALTPATSSPEARALFDKAISQINASDPAGLDTLTQAANLGLPLAQLKLADLYQGGTDGATRNLTEARTWTRRAAASGDPRSMHAYGMYLFEGTGGPRNRPEALDWLLKAADRGWVDSQFNAAKIYETGDEGIAPNPTEALKWYLIAAKTGDQQARAAADRLSAKVPAAGRQAARDAANAFAVEPAGV